MQKNATNPHIWGVYKLFLGYLMVRIGGFCIVLFLLNIAKVKETLSITSVACVCVAAVLFFP